MSDIYQIKQESTKATVTDVDGIKGVVTGYFAHFNNVDSDGDIIRPGSFKKTIKEQGPDSAQPRIKHLLNHDPSQPLGKLLSLKEDKVGLAYESQVGSHTLGQDFIKMIESGLITEHSIGFRTMKKNQLQPYENYIKNPKDGMFEITEMKLYEGSSLTAWGANSLTPITGLKSEIDVDLVVARVQAIEKFCKNTTATDDTIEMLLLHSKQLAQLVLDMKKGTEPMEIIQPSESFADIIREFNNKLK